MNRSFLAKMEEGTSAFKILTDEPTGKSLSIGSRRRWEDIIAIDHKEIGIRLGI